MEFFDNVLAALTGVLNGLPQGILALAFGFASVPTALAFIIGAVGNTMVGSVAVISFQAETISLAGTLGRNIRERLSMIFFGASIMLVIGLFGMLERIVDWIGPVISGGMMAGVGLILAKISLDMAKKYPLVGYSSMAIAFVTYMLSESLVYTIATSVIISSIISFFVTKDEKSGLEVDKEKEKFRLQKFILNPVVIRGALAMATLNIGANIAFGNLNGQIAGSDVNVDHLAVISSLADMASSLFGGGPVEAIISATSDAPDPVLSGVMLMTLMAIILFAGLLPKIGKYIPGESIAGFLIVLGAIVTVPPNAAQALGGDGSIVGGVTMVVTAITDPFIGMVAGVITQAFFSILGG